MRGDINRCMKLFEVSPTVKWNPASTDAKSTATIKTEDHTYELVIRGNRPMADYIAGWITRVIIKQDDMESGRFVELTLKQNRQSFAGVDDVMDKVVSAIASKAKDQRLHFVYMHSSSPRRREVFEKLTKKLAKKLEWEVYQDRNYFVVYRRTLEIQQAKMN